eukprot:g26470.t1
MALNEAIPAERVTSKLEMKDFTKNLSEVKASCASLLEQIAALQAAHEEAMAGGLFEDWEDILHCGELETLVALGSQRVSWPTRSGFASLDS